VTKLSTADAMQYLLAHDFCNPHQSVRDNRKIELRKEFFRSYFEQTDVHLVNTASDTNGNYNNTIREKVMAKHKKEIQLQNRVSSLT